jgi:hypothetical protein
MYITKLDFLLHKGPLLCYRAVRAILGHPVIKATLINDPSWWLRERYKTRFSYGFQVYSVKLFIYSEVTKKTRFLIWLIKCPGSQPYFLSNYFNLVIWPNTTLKQKCAFYVSEISKNRLIDYTRKKFSYIISLTTLFGKKAKFALLIIAAKTLQKILPLVRRDFGSFLERKKSKSRTSLLSFNSKSSATSRPFWLQSILIY